MIQIIILFLDNANEWSIFLMFFYEKQKWKIL